MKPPRAFSYAQFLQQVNASCQPVLGDDEVIAAAKGGVRSAPYPLAWLCATSGVVLTVLLSAATYARGSHSRVLAAAHSAGLPISAWPR